MVIISTVVVPDRASTPLRCVEMVLIAWRLPGSGSGLYVALWSEWCVYSTHGALASKLALPLHTLRITMKLGQVLSCLHHLSVLASQIFCAVVTGLPEMEAQVADPLKCTVCVGVTILCRLLLLKAYMTIHNVCWNSKYNSYWSSVASSLRPQQSIGCSTTLAIPALLVSW